MSLFNIGRGVMSTKKKKWYLEFDGIDDYAEARSTNDLNFALPIKVGFELHAINRTWFISRITTSNYNEDGTWGLSNPPSDASQIGLYYQGASTVDMRYPYIPTVATKRIYEAKMEGGDLVHYVDGIEIGRTANFSPAGSQSPSVLVVGASTDKKLNLDGKIFSFQIGTETFPMNEGNGTTITGSEGTVLDIYGATWGYAY